MAQVFKPYHKRLIQALGRVNTQQNNDAAFGRVIEKSLLWANGRAKTSLPKKAFEGENFEKILGELSLRAVRVNSNSLDQWALQLRHPDDIVKGRYWTTDITLSKINPQKVYFGLRLNSVSPHRETSVLFSTPRILKNIAKSPGLLMDGYGASPKPHIIDVNKDPKSLNLLTERLDYSKRASPFLVISLPWGSTDVRTAMVDPYRLAKLTFGTTHVFVLTEDSTLALYEKYGKSITPVNGAIRIFNPGFDHYDVQPEEIRKHPLFLPRSIATWNGGPEAFENNLRHMLYAAASQKEIDSAVPTFSKLKELWLQRALTKLSEPPKIEKLTNIPIVKRVVDFIPQKIIIEEPKPPIAPLIENTPDAKQKIIGEVEVTSHADEQKEFAPAALEASGAEIRKNLEISQPEVLTNVEINRDSKLTGGDIFPSLPSIVQPEQMVIGAKVIEGDKLKILELTASLGAALQKIDILIQTQNLLREEADEALSLAADEEAIRKETENELEKKERELAVALNEIEMHKATPAISDYSAIEVTRRFPPLRDPRLLQEWFEAAIGKERMILHPRALKAASQSQLKDEELAYLGLLLLGHEYWTMKTIGGDPLRKIFYERAQRINLEIGGSIDPRKSRQYEGDYYLRQDGREIFLDMHLKPRTNSRDPKTACRIYYAWDDVTRKVLVGSLPAHLTNDLT